MEQAGSGEPLSGLRPPLSSRPRLWARLSPLEASWDSSDGGMCKEEGTPTPPNELVGQGVREDGEAMGQVNGL